MALRLRICSEHRRTLRNRSTVVFGVAGGTIGRSADNDWVLPDQSRFISGRHARIHFRHGSYYLEDTSTNGTYLNDSEQPIPKQTPCELHNGDLLRLGEYEIIVAIDAEGEAHEATEDIDVDALDLPLTEGVAVLEDHRETSPGGAPIATPVNAPQVEGDLNASLNTDALFGRDAAQSDNLKVGNAFGQSVVLPFAGGGARPARPPRTDSSDIIAARRMERLHRAAQGRDRGPAGTGAPGRSALEALCRGAGIEPRQLGADPAVAQVLQLAGRLLREALVGLRDVAMHESEVRHRFGLGAAQADGEDPPFDLRQGADELLAKLLQSHESRRLDAGLWLRQVFENRKRHEEALAAAGTGAFREFMQQLEPRDLEERWERTAKRNPFGARPGNWDLYKELYRSLMEVPAEANVPHTFAEGFASNYQAAVKPEPRDK